MERTQIISFCLGAIQSKHMILAETYLTDDFVFGRADQKPMNKHEWIDLHDSLANSLRDFAFNLRDIQEHDGQVTAKMRISGLHNNVMLLPHIPPVLPTGKTVVLPTEQITFSFKGDKISHIEVAHVANGGVEGILEQIGAFAHAHV